MCVNSAGLPWCSQIQLTEPGGRLWDAFLARREGRSFGSAFLARREVSGALFSLRRGALEIFSRSEGGSGTLFSCRRVSDIESILSFFEGDRYCFLG